MPNPPDQSAADQQDVMVLRGVGKVFRDFWMRPRVRAVQDLDLTVRRGEVLGLLGPNGSGKSTTIKMILGLLYPSSGRIAVLGKPPTDVSLKSRIGYLPEDSNLYRFLDAEETLDFYGRLFKLDATERKARIESLLDMVGLRASRYRAVGEMSKGMKRRVALAQALINDPDILILDEPTAGMDPIAAREVKDLIKTLKRRGKTVILCTHLLGDVEDVCDRLAIMYGGKLRREGPTQELLDIEGQHVVETQELDAEDIAEVTALLQRRGKRVDAVRPGRQRLEDLFMGVIREAEAGGEQTTGASIGGDVASFLAEGDDAPHSNAPHGNASQDKALLSELRRPEPVKPVAATPDQPVEPAAGVDVSVLDDVADRPAPPPTAPLPAEDADDEMLRELTGKRD